MLKEVTLPEISENVNYGTVVSILVSEGDRIEVEQPIAELETDKATFEVPSPENGIVKEIKIKANEEVKVGSVLITVETESEQGKGKNIIKEPEREEKGVHYNQENYTEANLAEGKNKEVMSKRQEPGEENDKVNGGYKDEKQTEAERVKMIADLPASPSVRRLARELDVPVNEIRGTGPGKRITADDVKKAANKMEDHAGIPEGGPELPDFTRWGIVERRQMSGVRKTTAARVMQAWQTIPQVTQFDEADISGVEKFIDKYRGKAEKAGDKLTITSIMIKISAMALQHFPQFNASIDMRNKEIIFKSYYHIGIAVDTPQGLLVPVIRDVNKKSILKLSAEVSELAEKARTRKISLEELQGGCFSISNLGGIGGTGFTPIIYPPQVALLGISRSFVKPVFRDNRFVPVKMLPLTLTYDHRAIDGAQGARFLRWICSAMEDPFIAMMEGGEA